jgi:outer membrane receptor protein involved in Fe transport
LVTTSLYADDRISRTLGNGWLVNLQGGLRLDLLHRGSTWASGTRDQLLQPRLQAEVAPTPWLRFRAGAGRLAKVPSLGDLHPARQYYDLINFNYFANDPLERRAILTTRILDRNNPDLRMSRADKAEAGFELDLGEGSQLAVVGYADRIRGGVGVVAEPTYLIRDRYRVDSATIGTGRPPAVIEPPFAMDTIPTLIDRPDNNVRLRSRGMEVTAILPEIAPLRLRIAIAGAWSISRLESADIEFTSAFAEFQLNERISRAPYWQGTVRTGDRILATTRLIHHQPNAGLVITGTLQTYLREVLRNEAGTDTLAFGGYLTRAGVVVPVPRDQRGLPQFADLRVPRSGVLIDPQRGPVDWLFSLQVTKTLPLDGRLSFYAFNAFDRIGSFGGRTTTPRTFASTRFGLELTAPLGLAWGER